MPVRPNHLFLQFVELPDGKTFGMLEYIREQRAAESAI